MELGEEFKLDINDEIYQITKDGMFRKKMNDEGKFDMWEEVPCCFIKLLGGNAEVIKLPWRPKEGDIFYSFDIAYGKWVACSYIWAGVPCDYALLDKGWIYRTEAEVKAALPDVAKELGVEYEL